MKGLSLEMASVLWLLVFCCPIVISEAAGVKAGYWYYDSGLSPADIDASLFTHIFYAFLVIDSSTATVSPPQDNGAIQSFISTLRLRNPSIKALISIGGGSSDATAAFSAVASSPSSRQTFINSTINLAKQYSFDGIDFDWEYPQSQSEMDNFAALLSECRQAAGTSTLLTAAVHFNATRRDVTVTTYPVDAINQNLDWLNLMEYDLHGPGWEPTTTGEHTALYDAGTQSVDYGVTHWLSAGLLADKAVVGLAMYGRSWYLVNASENGVGAPADGGPDTLTYDQIKANFGETAVCRVDDATKCAYCYGNMNDRLVWVGYDNADTIATKVDYLKQKNLRGYFFWNLGGDENGDLSKQASQSFGV